MIAKEMRKCRRGMQNDLMDERLKEARKLVDVLLIMKKRQTSLKIRGMNHKSQRKEAISII